MVRSLLFFALAGLCEIGGGYLIWLWLREGKSPWYALPGAVVLILYGIIPTLQPASFGRVYAPFGESRNSHGNLGTDIKFTGQRLDDTGLYYYGARYYDPAIGRFISADTVVPSFRNPQALNRYSYVANNPLRYTDPTGREWVDDGWGGWYEVPDGPSGPPEPSEPPEPL